MGYNQDILDIIPLLDDPDQYIQDALFRELRNMGRPAIEQLEVVFRKEGEDKFPGAGKMLSSLREYLKYDALASWIEDTEDDLVGGLCLIQDILTGDVDRKALQDMLMDSVNEVCVEIRDEQTVMEKVKLFNHVFFHRLGFRTVDPMFSKPENTYFHTALKKREGSPITTGIIYLLMAYHSGISVRGRVFRGGFLPAVTDVSGNVLFYVNVYKNGLLFPHNELESFLKELNLKIPRETFREAMPEVLYQIYAETLYYSFSSAEDDSGREAVSSLEKIIGMFGKENSLLIEIDEDDE